MRIYDGTFAYLDRPEPGVYEIRDAESDELLCNGGYDDVINCLLDTCKDFLNVVTELRSLDPELR